MDNGCAGHQSEKQSRLGYSWLNPSCDRVTAGIDGYRLTVDGMAQP